MEKQQLGDNPKFMIPLGIVLLVGGWLLNGTADGMELIFDIGIFGGLLLIIIGVIKLFKKK